LYKGNYDSSKQLLREITGNLKDDNANDALELLLLLNTNMNDSSNIKKFAEAEFLAETKKFEEASELFRLISQDPRALVLYSISSLRFAQMMLAVDRYTDGIAAFQVMVDDGEKNIFADKALYLMGQTYQYGIGDKTKAIECYEKLLLQFPNSIYLDEAREKLIQLKNKLS
jgi:TolA-binding protein